MLRRLPQIAEGVAIFDLLCLGDEDVPALRIDRHPHPRAAEVGPGHVAAVADAVVKAVAHRSQRRMLALYAAIEKDDPEQYADELIDRLVGAHVPEQELRTVGRWLATHGVHHGPVGVGIILLGIAGFGEAEDVVDCLGSDPEFTGIAAIAAERGAADPDEFLWRLARGADGERRAECVRRLSRSARDDIKAWILREGWAAAAGNAAAITVASGGELHRALESDLVDDELLDATARILRALTQLGASPNLTDYPEGPAALEAYLRHVVRRRDRLADFLAVESIRRFLLARGDRVTPAWGAPLRADAIGRCTAVLALEEWDAVILDAFATAGRDDFATMAPAAEARGIDTFPYHLARLEADPTGSWQIAFEHADQMRARRLAAAAARWLRAIPEEGDTALVWGALESILDGLSRHPGVGGDVVMLGLSAKTPVHRMAALRTLEAWRRDSWPADAEDAVAAAADQDPDAAVRTFARRLRR